MHMLLISTNMIELNPDDTLLQVPAASVQQSVIGIRFDKDRKSGWSK